MMNRMACLEVLKTHVTDEIVVASYSTAHDWLAINDRPLNYFSFGAMGLCSSHGLGLALARPERRIIVLDGDGSLLMNLGTLVTIAAVAPKNFVHLVWHNSTYEANGGHPIPNQNADFAGMARAAGIVNVYKINDMANFTQQIGTIIRADGPVFGEMMVEQGLLGPRDYKDMYKPDRRRALREALGV